MISRQMQLVVLCCLSSGVTKQPPSHMVRHRKPGLTLSPGHNAPIDVRTSITLWISQMPLGALHSISSFSLFPTGCAVVPESLINLVNTFGNS